MPLRKQRDNDLQITQAKTYRDISTSQLNIQHVETYTGKPDASKPDHFLAYTMKDLY